VRGGLSLSAGRQSFRDGEDAASSVKIGLNAYTGGSERLVVRRTSRSGRRRTP